MSEKVIIRILKNFQKTSLKSSNSFSIYLNNFEDKMIYRTTKSENPEVSMKMVKKILQKLSIKSNEQKTRRNKF